MTPNPLGTWYDDNTWKALGPPPPPPPPVVKRDARKQPFVPWSIWNLAVGAPRFVPAGLKPLANMAFFCDADILIQTPTAPPTAVLTSYDDWGAGTRCAAAGPVLFTAPIPSDFVIPGNHQGSPDGDTPNAACSILLADGHTIQETAPFARCVAGTPPTSHYVFPQEDLYGLGHAGCHGASHLSGTGGTVRLGELVPGGRIPHAMKLNIDSNNFFSRAPGGPSFRWPATHSDGGYFTQWYGGGVPECTMGSLLALPAPMTGLETEPGRIVARAFYEYGAYIVETSGWSVLSIPTERSPEGSVQDEFARVWGFPLNANVGANGWARDLAKIFVALQVVDSWDAATHARVSASAGKEGAGGGPPRVPWAAPI